LSVAPVTTPIAADRCTRANESNRRPMSADVYGNIDLLGTSTTSGGNQGRISIGRWTELDQANRIAATGFSATRLSTLLMY
jgi:hypothetical protein